MMIQPLEELVEALCTLPAIGKKSAWRLALHLMERPEQEVLKIAESIINVRKKLTRCRRCFNYSEADLCPVCSSASRDQTQICVVEKPVDLFAFERSGRYRGIYHILGGVLSPLNGITVDKLRINELSSRIRIEQPRELILGLGGSADAETTALYLARLYRQQGVRVTRLARGLPVGMELEYVDQITLSQALNERTDVHYES
ncbi:MAG TPA: recombination mediator RecR [Chitinispirillaceae bacterium]|nr:recombination mediator RecR [Chitinispirillaceae bacterium]